jgi:hypothetical protein
MTRLKHFTTLHAKIIICVFFVLTYFSILSPHLFSQVYDTSNYFPLVVGSTFKYYIAGPCPPKTIFHTGDFYAGNKVYDSLIIDNKKYFTFQVAHLQPGIDTVRVDENGDVIIRRRGKDLIFYRLKAKINDSWIYLDTVGGNERKYTVTLKANKDTIDVHSGIFYNCLKFEFEGSGLSIPHTDWLASNIGLVFRCMQDVPFELYEATIAGRKYPLTGVKEQNKDIKYFKLYQNYPNPFNPETTIKYELNASMNVNLSIYDVLGRELITLVDEYKQSGVYEIKWNGKGKNGFDAPSGIYLLLLNIPDDNTSKVLLKMK